MKKAITFILVLVGILTILSFACADIDNEILFRGMPWGTSVTEFSARIQTDMLKSGNNTISDKYTLYSWENGTKKNMDDPLYSLKDAGYRCFTFPDAQVAGIPINEIEAYFTFTYENSTIYRGEDESSLYYAEYDLKPVDIGMTFPILKEKMTSLYGSGHEESATVNVTNLGGNDYTRYLETVTWYGANNTGVRLFMQYHVDKVDGTTEYKYLKLTYGKTNSVELLTDLKDALAKEEMNKVLTDTSTDGL